jgi:diguanylate cyclase (GGDEF)-like protein/PAS domain S-box-containing protein
MQAQGLDTPAGTAAELAWLSGGACPEPAPGLGVAPESGTPRWTVLIVDDDPAVHEVTELVLSGSRFLGRSLDFVHAHSGAQGRSLLQQRPEVALVLLDVVMESDQAGLDLVKFIRGDLGNARTRILLRTGQAGAAIQTEIVTGYDVNGYLDKALLTSPQLFCAVHTALSTYRDLATLDTAQRDLRLSLHEARYSENRFRSLLNNSPIGLAEVGLDGSFVGVNPALCEMLGYSAAELTAKTFQDITHPDDLAMDLANVQQLLDGKREAYRMDKRYFHKSGCVVHIQLDVVLLRDEAGQPDGFLAQIQNIENRIATEQSLRALGQRLSMAVQSAHIGVWSWDLKSGRLSWDPQMYDIYGVAPGAAVSHEDWKKTLLAEDLEAAEAQLARTVGQRCASDNRFRIRHPLRGLRYIEASEDVMLDATGEVVAVVGVNRDVTRQRLMEDALLQRQAEIVKLSLTDPLTGVANRRRMDEQLDTEVSRVQRYGGTLSLAIADLDHFKRINDEYGHEVGDAVLKAFSRVMESHVRDTDLIARMGGEEFVILMPQSGCDAAETVAERIRLSLARSAIPPLRHPVTVSFGIAEMLAGEAGGQLLRRADQAMYKAKTGGRNRTVVSTDGILPQTGGKLHLVRK